MMIKGLLVAVVVTIKNKVPKNIHLITNQKPILNSHTSHPITHKNLKITPNKNSQFGLGRHRADQMG